MEEDYPIKDKELLQDPSNSCEGTCDRYVADTDEVEEVSNE
ncbi:MAG TPA: hypothetical protein V6C57_07570 [Coleofasciculaceae cyanobacterium]